MRYEELVAAIIQDYVNALHKGCTLVEVVETVGDLTRGRLYALSNDKVNALEDFDHAVVMEYHYPVAHFYRGKDAEIAAAHHANNMQHLSRCLSLDPTIAGAYTVRGALHLRDLRFNNALQDFKAAVTTDPTLSEACFIRFVEHVAGDSPASRQGVSPAEGTNPCVDNKPMADTKGALLLCGRAFQLLSRFQSAVHAFEQAVTENPTSENLVLLSESLHSLGDTENSLRVSDKVVSADPSSFRGYVRRAQLLVSVGKLVHAMAEYDRAISLAPKEGPRDVERELGADAMKDEVLVRKMMQQFFVGSITDLSKCIRLEPLLADAYVDRAELNAFGEEYDRAFRDLETATERQPKHARAHCQFAAYAAAIEDFDKAIKLESAAIGEVLFASALEDLEEVQESAPDDDELHGALGFALLQLNRYEDAAKHFAAYGRLGRDTYVDSGNAYFNLATKTETHLDQMQHAAYLERARRFYLRAARLQPSNVDVRLNLANCLRKETQPLNHACLESKALALFQLPGRGDDAIASSLLAQMETPAPKVHLTGSHEQMLALYMLNRGIMLEKMGNLTRARQDFIDGLHFDPLSVHAHVCLGTLSLREHNFEQSAAEFQRALDLDPSSGVAHLNLGVVCLCRNELPTALAHFDAAIALIPRCSYAYANKAVALARSGNMAGAELHFKKAIEELPSRKEFYLARGKIVALQKRLHDAMVDFSTALFLGYDGKL
uniref:Uncharacterized protein n=1 Tax=Phytophthora ramorum TaxID=164328 RepID=H3HCV3_PHYRM